MAPASQLNLGQASWRLALSRPSTYAVIAPLMTIAGAATTIAAPILLTPATFGSFVLLMSLFQYLMELDLGLSRLADRTLSRPSDDLTGALRAFTLARFVVAGGLLIAVIIAALFTGILTALAGIAGIAFMLSNGPLSFYRATSRTVPFILTALLMQTGLSLPRLSGLLAGGVAGCMIALAAWYVMIAVALNAPFVGLLWDQRPVRLRQLFAASFPLCVFNSLWWLYLLSNRWMSWSMSGATDAGLFGFGANLVAIGIGVFALVAQAYYPRHLATTNKAILYRELALLLVIIAAGSLAGMLFCRFGLRLIFPRFEGGGSAAAVLLISGVPMCLCAWLVPLVIARSDRPWREALIMFGVAFIVLYAMMHLGNRAGIVGQAWGCLPSALVLLGMQMQLVVRNDFLGGRDAVKLWCTAVIVSSLLGTVWYVSF
jgi:O-antigen/teichoic acid export membrane protein